jgi:hypothetical protein
MLRDHAQAIADKLAIEEDGMLFHELPYSEQERIFKEACKEADRQLKELTR